MSTNELNNFLSSFQKPAQLDQNAWNEVIRQARNVWNAYLNGEDWEEGLNINCKESYMMLVSEEGDLIVRDQSLLTYVQNKEVTSWRKHLEDIAFSAIKNNRYGIAEKYFTKAIKLDESHALNYYRRGLLRMRLLKNKEALADLNTAIELNPNLAPFFLKRAQIYRLLDMDYKAMTDLNKAIKLDSTNPEGYEVRGKFRISLGDMAGGRTDLNRALELQSSHKTSAKELYQRKAA